MTQPKRVPIILVCALAFVSLGGCQRDEIEEAPAEPVPQPGWLVGSHTGQFPCVDCPGIDTRLWLTEGGVFFYRQAYLSADDSEDVAVFYAMGRWRWDADSGAVALEGDGPTRWFDPLDRERLQFRTNAQPEHLLDKEAVTPTFDHLVTVEGDYISAKVQRLQECRTGLSLAIAELGEGRRLRRQYRSMPRGQPIVAVVQGRLNADAAAITIERIVTLKPGKRCAQSDS